MNAALAVRVVDIGETCFLRTLIERLAREAPGVTLSTVRNSAVNLRDELESGTRHPQAAQCPGAGAAAGPAQVTRPSRSPRPSARRRGGRPAPR